MLMVYNMQLNYIPALIHFIFSFELHFFKLPVLYIKNWCTIITNVLAILLSLEMDTPQDNEDRISMASVDVGNQPSRHWVLSTLNDVAYLSTQIKFCREYSGDSEQRSERLQVLHL